MSIWIQTGANFGTLDVGVKTAQIALNEEEMEDKAQDYVIQQEQEKNPAATDAATAERMSQLRLIIDLDILSKGFTVDDIFNVLNSD